MSTEHPSSRSRPHPVPRAVFSLVGAATLFVSCAKPKPAERPLPPQSVAKTLVRSSNTFREGVSIRIPREISIEPRFGQGAAEAFASSFGRDVLAAEVLRSLSPSVAAMQDASVVRVSDSPIPEQFNTDAPADIGIRANTSTLSMPGYQRSHRYWRHYLRIEPVDLLTEDWIPDSGVDEADETMTTARVIRTPGWRATIARRELVAVDSMYYEGEALSILYRWRWAPSPIGAPFVSDTLAADRTVSDAAGAPMLSSASHRDLLSFVRTEDGWVARRGPVASSAAGPSTP
jgi:hypothetical protein